MLLFSGKVGPQGVPHVEEIDLLFRQAPIITVRYAVKVQIALIPFLEFPLYLIGGNDLTLRYGGGEDNSNGLIYFRFNLEPATVGEIDRPLRLSERVLRHMVVKIAVSKEAPTAAVETKEPDADEAEEAQGPETAETVEAVETKE